MLKQLINLANHLDSRGLMKEADYLDSVILKLSSSNLKSSEEVMFSMEGIKEHISKWN